MKKIVAHRKDIWKWGLLVSCLLCYFIWLPAGHDTSVHLARIVNEAELMENLGMRNLPFYIYSSSHNGYGYGAPLFYCDLFIYPFALLVRLGMNKILAYKCLFLCIGLTAFICSYIAFFEWKKDKELAWVGAFLYVFHPYFAQDMVDRGAVGEVLALAFFPLVLCGLYYIYSWEQKRGMAFLVVGMGGVVCSHVISTLLICLLCVLVCLLNIRKILVEKRIAVSLIVAAVVCLCLTMWFWLPMIEQLLAVTFRVSQEGSDYVSHIVSLAGLVLPYSVQEILHYKLGIIKEIPPYAPGGMIWIVAVHLGYYIKTKEVRNNRYIKFFVASEMLILLLASSAIAAELMKNVFGIIQFPWRWYILLVPISVMCSIEIIQLVGNKSKKVIILLTVCITTVTTIVTMTSSMRYNYLEKNFGAEHVEEMDSLYVPAAFNGDYTDIVVYGNDNQVNYTRSYQSLVLNEIETDANSFILHLPLFYYKGYIAENKQNGTQYKTYEDEKGLVSIKIDQFDGGEIVVTYKGTHLQEISKKISFAALCVLALCIGMNVRRKGQISKSGTSKEEIK